MKKDNIKIAYIGGGSRQWARNIMSDLVLEEEMGGEVRLYDIDFEAAEVNALIGNMFNTLESSKTTWKYKSYEKLEDTLTDVDFVIISITPGTIANEMASDVHTPEKYGIFQAVGDTVGPGGYMRAMRMIPIYQGFAKAIKKFCPNAWVINYTNPMTLCVRTLYETYPEIKAFGCCHEVFGTQELLMNAMNEKLGTCETDRTKIKINVSGINHFTWIDEAFYDSIDLLPIYKEYSIKNESGIIEEGRREDPFFNAHKVKFDLFKRYGVIAAAGDRHLIEFLPQWYLKDSKDQYAWEYRLTTVEQRVKKLEDKDLEAKQILSGEKELVISPSGEEGVQQIKAILGLRTMVTNVNLPNRGQISWLPKGAVVETNAVFKSGSVTPVHTKNLPRSIQSLVLPHVLNQEILVDSFMNKDRNEIFNMFANEPMIKKLSLNEAKELFESMIQNTESYLPDWLKKS